MRTTILLLIIACAYLYVSRGDYQAAVAQQAEVRVTKARCAERDYLGRRLIASYYARSDKFQTMRCTYRRITA